MAEEEKERRFGAPVALIVVLSVGLLIMGLASLERVGLVDIALPGVFLGIAACMFLLALAAFWQSFRSMFGGGPDIAGVAVAESSSRAALRDEKQTLLRALKDISFEHEVGKISDDDFERLNRAYRSRAKEVLRQLDQDIEPYIAKAERLIASVPETKSSRSSSKPSRKKKSKKTDRKSARVRDVVLEAREAERATEESARAITCPACETENATDATFCKKCAARLAPLVCAACETENDADAKFCKRCAKPLSTDGGEAASLGATASAPTTSAEPTAPSTPKATAKPKRKRRARAREEGE